MTKLLLGIPSFNQWNRSSTDGDSSPQTFFSISFLLKRDLKSIVWYELSIYKPLAMNVNNHTSTKRHQKWIAWNSNVTTHYVHQLQSYTSFWCPFKGSKFWLFQKLWHKMQIIPFPFFCDFLQKHSFAVFSVFLRYVS